MLFQTVATFQIVIVLSLTLGQFCSAADNNATAIKKPYVDFGGELEKERIMTKEEKIAFDKFKRNVKPHIFRKEMDHDLFLLRWIRAKNLDVDLALKDFIALKNFYFDNNIDKINDEDWSDFEQDFPVHRGGVDKEGRPVSCIDIREGWDIRGAILQGKRTRMQRYLVKLVFDLLLVLRDKNREDPRVTQFVIIINAVGFNIIQHGCPRCLHSLMMMFEIYERFLPGFPREIIVVEAPSALAIAYQFVRPALSKHTQNSVKIFDKNRSQWMQYIHQRIDPSQLPSFLGGTKPEKY